MQQLGYLPHRRSIEYVKGADLLLLVGGRHRWEETAKVYEYLASGKPIFALLRLDGAAADILRPYSQARILRSREINDAISALAETVVSGISVQPSPTASI